MKRIFIAAFLLVFTASLGSMLEAADKPAPSSSSGPDQSQILVKLNELQVEHKQILQQLADMKQELYAIKIRASRC